MRIGQIVFIKDKNLPNVQTGIITKRQKEDNHNFWYEVLCNDGQNYVLPGFLLSPRPFTPFTWTKEMHEKRANSVHACINHTHNKLHYIHNDKQTT